MVPPSAAAAPPVAPRRGVAWQVATGVVAALALASAAFLIHWGATRLQRPRALLEVISDAPAEVSLPVEGSCRTPCRLELEAGTHPLRITFLETQNVLVHDVRLGEGQHLELRLRVPKRRP